MLYCRDLKGKPSDELFSKMKTLIQEHVKSFLA